MCSDNLLKEHGLEPIKASELTIKTRGGRRQTQKQRKQWKQWKQWKQSKRRQRR
jgi:hypothetical protein